MLRRVGPPEGLFSRKNARQRPNRLVRHRHIGGSIGESQSRGQADVMLVGYSTNRWRLSEPWPESRMPLVRPGDPLSGSLFLTKILFDKNPCRRPRRRCASAYETDCTPTLFPVRSGIRILLFATVGICRTRFFIPSVS